MPGNKRNTVHLAQRCDLRTLIDTPEVVLQQLSFKILERREQALKDLVNQAVAFHVTGGGIQQGIVQSVTNQFCFVRVNQALVKVSLKKIIL